MISASFISFRLESPCDFFLYDELFFYLSSKLDDVKTFGKDLIFIIENEHSSH